MAEVGGSMGAMRRTLMTRVVFGRDRAAAVAKLGDGDVAALEARGAVVGGPDEVRERLAAFAAAGVERLMLQWVDDLDDLAGIGALARAVAG